MLGGLRRRRREPELEELERSLVWILGGPRTGSTWLLELLAYPLSPSTDWPAGSTRRPASGVTPRALPINEPYLGMHLAPIVTAGEDAGSVFAAPDIRARDPSYFLDERWAPAWRPGLRHLVLARLAAQASAARAEHGLEAPLVLVKEPNGSEAAPLIGSTLPRSRILFLLRDGRDVLDSLLDATSSGGWLAGGRGSDEDRLAFLRRSAALWVHRTRAVQRAVEAHADDLALTVRYEDLRADPLPVLRQIESWLGLEHDGAALSEAVSATSFEAYPAEAKGRGKPLRLAQPGHWREALSTREQEAVRAVMGETLRAVGYAV